MWLKKSFIFLGIVLLWQLQIQACCGLVAPKITTKEYNSNGNHAIIVQVSEIIFPTNIVPFSDTLYSSEFLNRLQTAYNTSKFVVISRVTDVMRSFPDNVELSTPLSESATVNIDMVLKGTLQQKQKTQINEIDGNVRKLIYDSVSGTYDTAYILCSILEPGYEFIKGKRFLIFAQDEDQCFNLPLVPMCLHNTNNYLINSNNEIFYDGIDIDFENQKVIHTPDLKISLSHLTIPPPETVPVKKNIRIANKSSFSKNTVSVYNLLGLQIPASSIHSNKASSSLLILRQQSDKMQRKQIIINKN